MKEGKKVAKIIIAEGKAEKKALDEAVKEELAAVQARIVEKLRLQGEGEGDGAQL